MADSLDVDLDLLHLLALAADDALPVERTRAVVERELARLSTAMAEHFAVEEEIARRAGDPTQLVEEHRRLTERLRHTRHTIRNGSAGAMKAELMELLDALGEHERRENDAASET